MGPVIRSGGGVFKSAIVITTLSVLLGACASVSPLSPSRAAIDSPAIGQTTVAELGGVVVERGQSSRYDGLMLDNEISWFDLFRLRKFVLESGPLVAREADETFVYYYSEKLSYRDLASGIGSPVTGGLCIRKDDPHQARAFVVKGVCGVVPDQRPRFTRLSFPDARAQNLRRELIYGGRSGSSLSFVYRELNDDRPTPTFSMDFRVDLSEGMTFGFRGARIEVVDASNVALTYRVVETFADLAP